jgi:Ser/Thr protein kinase RdoA (MazF antagonist)
VREIAAVIRDFHEAVATMEPPGCNWNDIAADPSGNAEILCHNDLAPWNLIRADERWVFIDWDLAAPGRRAWDVGWAMLSLVPFLPERVPPLPELEARLAAFCEGYGIDAVPEDVVDVAWERASYEAKLIHERGRLGIEPHARLLREGHGDLWQATAELIRANGDIWTRLVRGIIRSDRTGSSPSKLES